MACAPVPTEDAAAVRASSSVPGGYGASPAGCQVPPTVGGGIPGAFVFPDNSTPRSFPGFPVAEGYGQPPTAAGPKAVYGSEFSPAYVPPAGYGSYPVYGGYPAPGFSLRPCRPSRLKNATKALNVMGLLVLGQTGLGMVFGFLLGMAVSLTGINLGLWGMTQQWMSAALVPLSTALPFAIYLGARREYLTEYLRFEKVGFLNGLLCVLAGLGICLLGNFPSAFIQEIFGRFGYEPAESFSPYATLAEILVDFFVTAIVVPVMEEFAFRGVLFSHLRRYGAGFAIAASSIVFSLVHLDFSNVVFAFIAGIVFAFLYEKTGNLWVSICIHALNNGLAVFQNYSSSLLGSLGDLVGLWSFWGSIVVGLIALVLLLTLRRQLLFQKKARPGLAEVQPLRAGEAASCIARSVVLWLIVGLMVAYTVSLFLL